jgi:peptide-methionine (R)-S-oxide reductase
MGKKSLRLIFSSAFILLVMLAGHSAAQIIKIFDPELNKVVLVTRIEKSGAQWKKLLTPEQYDITVKQGTETPFTHEFHQVKGDGIYQCVRCGTALFRSSAKFESGTGWPSFFAPISGLNVSLRPDHSLFMIRTEVLCARCGAHLGHVFDDGPPPTHKRYCMNGIALRFVKLAGNKSVPQN